MKNDRRYEKYIFDIYIENKERNDIYICTQKLIDKLYNFF